MAQIVRAHCNVGIDLISHCSATEHEASLTRYMKVSKKKDLPKVREDASEDLFVYRKKRHQVGTFLFDFP